MAAQWAFSGAVFCFPEQQDSRPDGFEDSGSFAGGGASDSAYQSGFSMDGHLLLSGISFAGADIRQDLNQRSRHVRMAS